MPWVESGVDLAILQKNFKERFAMSINLRELRDAAVRPDLPQLAVSVVSQGNTADQATLCGR